MDHLTLEGVAEALIPQAAADWLITLCQHTGQTWGPNASPELFWYRPPKVHIFEFIFLMLFAWYCIYASWGYCTHVRKRTQFVSLCNSTRSRLNKLLSVFLLVCWMFQVLFKACRANPFIQLGWMLMPCHLLTLLWAVVLRRGSEKEYPLNVYLASLAAGYAWGPVSAAASPDFGDHQYTVEQYIFVLQHGLLLVLPFYFAARYELLPMTTKHFLHVSGVAVFINIGFYTLYSYVSGLNVNYMLYPPPKLIRMFPFTSVAYRFYVIGLLMALTVMFHVVTSLFGKSIRWVLLRHQIKPRTHIKELNLRQ